MEKKSIHVRLTPETKDKWLEICQVMEGNTQSKVFRQIVDKLSSNLKETFSIGYYGKCKND